MSALSRTEPVPERRLLDLCRLRPGRHHAGPAGRSRQPTGRDARIANQWRTPAPGRVFGPVIMNRHRFSELEDEAPVFLSLVVSCGMILVSILGWWMWKIFAQIGEAMVAITSLAIP
jgi:hypothetical protein